VANSPELAVAHGDVGVGAEEPAMQTPEVVGQVTVLLPGETQQNTSRVSGRRIQLQEVDDSSGSTVLRLARAPNKLLEGVDEGHLFPQKV